MTEKPPQAKEGIVLDREGNPVHHYSSASGNQSQEHSPHERFHERFRIRFGSNAMKMTAGSFPGKLFLGILAIGMLAVGAVIVTISIFVFFFKLVFRSLFGGGKRN